MHYNKIKITFSLFMVLQFASGFSMAQHNEILDNFTVQEISGEVFLNWTITSGNTCNGIQIYRSSDGITFTQIGDFAGVCGSSSIPTPYSFLDRNPVKNSRNFYQLELGGYGKSEIISVEVIDIIIGGYQVRPNPVNSEAVIFFDNDTKAQHQFILYTLSSSHVTTLTTTEDFFHLEANFLPSGLYFFNISNSNKVEKAKGRILIQH